MSLAVSCVDSFQLSTLDYQANIDTSATEGYDVIITLGSSMGDATALKARQYPDIQFAIVDYAYAPTSVSQSCNETVVNCSADGGLSNVNVQTSSPDIPTSLDSTEGKETALRLMNAGCDVVFGIAANGALLAAQERNLMGIGFETDQYYTSPEVQDALLSFAQKNVDVADYNYLIAVASRSVRAGICTGTLQNGGIGLAPFHDWDSRIPTDLKARIQQASEGIKEGSITIDLPQ